MTWLIYGLWFGAVALAGVGAYPLLAKRVDAYATKRALQTTEQLGDMFVDLPQQNVWMMYVLAPIVIGAVAWFATGRWLVGVATLPLGLVAPQFMVTHMARARKQKFYAQLVDGLLLLSSSLKAGLSMIQAFTVLTEEMPQPISQEFGLVLKETRMGVNLEEAMLHLKERMPSDDVNLFVTAVLVARETGGDVTRIFTRLVETLRERKKIKERIKTLTFMARMQGIIMGMLPFVFGWVVYNMNPGHFEFFLHDPAGRVAAGAIGMLTSMSAVLFIRFARSPM